jgi:type IV secretory pathway VirB2 component (pilin)
MKNTKAIALLTALAPAVVVGAALAYDATTTTTADGTAQINDALQLFVTYLEGPLGTLIAIVAFMIGLGVTAYSQSMFGVLGGLFVALLAKYGASIIIGAAGSAESAL